MSDIPEALARRTVPCNIPASCEDCCKVENGQSLCKETGMVPESAEAWALRNAAIAMEILNAAYPESVTYWHMSREQMLARKLEDAAARVKQKEQGNDQPR